MSDQTIFRITRILLTLFVVGGYAGSSTAQINNPGFEQWEMIDTAYKPVGWNAAPVFDINYYDYITGDTLSMEGDSSVRFAFTPQVLGPCDTRLYHTGRIKTTDQAPLLSLFFWVKSIPHPEYGDGENHVEVRGAVFREDQDVGQYQWISEQFFPEFTLIEVPIPVEHPDSITLEFIAGASPQPIFVDGCHKFSVTWLDDLTIAPTLINSADANLSNGDTKIEAFPNPNAGEFVIRQEEFVFDRAELFDARGRNVRTFRMTTSTTKFQHRQSGLYLLRLSTTAAPSTSVITKRIVIF